VENWVQWGSRALGAPGDRRATACGCVCICVYIYVCSCACELLLSHVLYGRFQRCRSKALRAHCASLQPQTRHYRYGRALAHVGRLRSASSPLAEAVEHSIIKPWEHVRRVGHQHPGVNAGQSVELGLSSPTARSSKPSYVAGTGKVKVGC
jgi:hypothetical protein